MKFKVVEWSLIELYKRRNEINFPVFQRGHVWSEKKNELLIDSILNGIDIPKLYLQRTDQGWDVIDGQQRIRAIVGFFDEEYAYQGKYFGSLAYYDKNKIETYKLTITEVLEITNDEIRTLFNRLQLGVPLNSGEKLFAISSNLGDFVRIMSKEPFLVKVSIPKRRFAIEQVCAQICNNSIYINKTGEFRNSKYEDLATLYRIHKDFDLESKPAKKIMSIIKKLNTIFSNSTSEIRNRASIVSIYLMVEDMIEKDEFIGNEILIKNFYLTFLSEIKEEVNMGIDARNKFLMNYQSRVIQGADTKSSITFRHETLREAFIYYKNNKEIIRFAGIPSISYNVNPIYIQNDKPRTGFSISNTSNQSVQVKIQVKVYVGKEFKEIIKTPYYSGETLWNINPNLTVMGNFALKKEWIESTEKLTLEFHITIYDTNKKEYHQLPTCYTYVKDRNIWNYEPTSFSELKKFKV